MIDHSEHFQRVELECLCGCHQCEMDEFFMKHIEAARDLTNFPWHLTSAYRCPKHDHEIGGEGNHPKGKAVDIRWFTSNQLFELIYALGSVGFRRFGISFKGKFLHVDMILENPQRVVWGYL